LIQLRSFTVGHYTIRDRDYADQIPLYSQLFLYHQKLLDKFEWLETLIVNRTSNSYSTRTNDLVLFFLFIRACSIALTWCTGAFVFDTSICMFCSEPLWSPLSSHFSEVGACRLYSDILALQYLCPNEWGEFFWGADNQIPFPHLFFPQTSFIDQL